MALSLFRGCDGKACRISGMQAFSARTGTAPGKPGGTGHLTQGGARAILLSSLQRNHFLVTLQPGVTSGLELTDQLYGLSRFSIVRLPRSKV